jgi:predicted nucleotidyltransferase
MMGNPTQQDLDTAKEVKKLLSNKIPIVSFRMYGSRARGTATWDSDLDLYIEVDSLTKEEEDFIDEIAFEVSLNKGIVISLFVVTKENLNNPLFLHSPLFKNIKRG